MQQKAKHTLAELRELLHAEQDEADLLKTEIEILKTQLSIKQSHFNSKNQLINNYQHLIEKQKQHETACATFPKITDHAILRYLERVKGIDVKAAEAEIVNQQVINTIKVLGANCTAPAGNYRVVMREGSVVTVLNNDM